jgi:hypothetical protein
LHHDGQSLLALFYICTIPQTNNTPWTYCLKTLWKLIVDWNCCRGCLGIDFSRKKCHSKRDPVYKTSNYSYCESSRTKSMQQPTTFVTNAYSSSKITGQIVSLVKKRHQRLRFVIVISRKWITKSHFLLRLIVRWWLFDHRCIRHQ